MRGRLMNLRYQRLSMAWLTLALVSFALPPARRLGTWLPLHLAVGAVATAISGAMQAFAQALTSTGEPPRPLVWAQLVSLTGAVFAVTLGVVSRTRWLVAAGGSAFLLAFVLLAWIVWRSWRRSIVRRHPVPVIAYGIALTSLLLGAGLGASLALGWAGQRYIGWRQAHLVLNVLGFASLTIVGTMLTLLPTVLRVRMSQRRGGAIVGLLGVGAAGLAFGAIAGEASPATIGAVAYVAGATTFVILVGSILRNERRWAVPVAGFHMVSGVGWFAIGSIWLAIAVARDQPMGRAFLDVFVLGWVVQVLIGAWSYLLPMMRPGDPGKHRSGLHALEVGGRTQVALLNAGVALLVMSDLGWWRGDMVGSLLAFAALAFALAKAWLLPVLDRLPTGPRARAVWG